MSGMRAKKEFKSPVKDSKNNSVRNSLSPRSTKLDKWKQKKSASPSVTDGSKLLKGTEAGAKREGGAASGLSHEKDEILTQMSAT